MRILVYGAGNIGCLYAALLSQGGHDVSVLARGHRLDAIDGDGIVLERFATGERSATRVRTISSLAADDAYDFVLVSMGREHVHDALPALASNCSPSVIFFGNNVVGSKPFVEALGVHRVLLGFPGAAGIPSDGAIRYVILAKADQPTTLGEPDGGESERVRAIASVFEGAGFPVAVSPRMDAWLKTHAAEILPTAYALYAAGGDVARLSRTRDALVLAVRGIREGYSVLRAAGVSIDPPSHRVFDWLPEALLAPTMRRMVSGESWLIKIGHANAAREEMRLLAGDFGALTRSTGVETPVLDRLSAHLDRAVPPIADGRREIRPRWWR